MANYLTQWNTDFQFTDAQLAVMNAEVESRVAAIQVADDETREMMARDIAARVMAEG